MGEEPLDGAGPSRAKPSSSVLISGFAGSISKSGTTPGTDGSIPFIYSYLQEQVPLVPSQQCLVAGTNSLGKDNRLNRLSSEGIFWLFFDIRWVDCERITGAVPSVLSAPAGFQ